MEATLFVFFFFQAEDGIRDLTVTGVQTCALPISRDLLDDLLLKLSPLNQAMVRDSAKHIFDLHDIAPEVKAYAAYVVGLATTQPPQNDRAAGCEWIRKAMNLDSSQPRYRDLFAQCRR